MQIRRASEFALADLTRFWNMGYTDYFSPVAFTEQMMESWIKAGGFDLDRCLVLMEGEALVGFSMLGVRGRHGWIGGFGVAPAYRGRGLASSLFADHVARFTEWGLEHVQLEVLVQNWAWKVYARSGFAITRRLSVLKGTLQAPADGHSTVGQAAPLDLLTYSDRLHSQHPACWQRTVPYLQNSLPANAIGLYTGPAAAPSGFAIAASSGTAVRLVDAAAQDDSSAAQLVAGVAKLYPGQAIVILNEPEGSPLHRALVGQAGATELHGQSEMHWRNGADA